MSKKFPISPKEDARLSVLKEMSILDTLEEKNLMT